MNLLSISAVLVILAAMIATYVKTRREQAKCDEGESNSTAHQGRMRGRVLR
jgi:hypothetical protein